MSQQTSNWAGWRRTRGATAARSARSAPPKQGGCCGMRSRRSGNTGRHRARTAAKGTACCARAWRSRAPGRRCWLPARRSRTRRRSGGRPRRGGRWSRSSWRHRRRRSCGTLLRARCRTCWPCAASGASGASRGELRLGVLQAQNPEAASRRLSTYQRRGEMHVVWLITRGRGFKSLPRYQGQRPFLEQRKGLCMWFVN